MMSNMSLTMVQEESVRWQKEKKGCSEPRGKMLRQLGVVQAPGNLLAQLPGSCRFLCRSALTASSELLNTSGMLCHGQ